MGKKKLKQHMRYILARYGAYSVSWCMAGEAIMPYYQDPAFQDLENFFPEARKNWTELTKYFRSIEAFGRPISIHCVSQINDMVEDNSILDFMMLQTGHADIFSLLGTVEVLQTSINQNKLPVLNSEVCYENIIGMNHDDIQRMMFWVCVLLGAAGHTYGANGMWQINSRERLYGPSPTGDCWGGQPWQDAYKLPGSYHVGVGKKILSRYEWNKIVYHPEWIERKKKWNAYSDDFEKYFIPYAAGIEGALRIIYLNPFFLDSKRFGGQTIVKNLENNVNYQAYWVDPRNGRDYAIGEVLLDSDGNWIIPDRQPYFADWIVTLETEGCRVNFE